MTTSRRLALRTALALFAVVGLVAALAPSSVWPNLARAHSPGSASLTALTVTAGGAAQALDPTFSSTEYSYTVSVVNSVAQVTVTATPDGDGTVAYQNTGGTTLTDADTTTAGQQVDLPMVGGMSVNVVVSHTDSGTTTTQTYTVLVIREGTAPPAPAIASLTPSNQALTVVWTAPASDGGSAITSYDLRYIATDAEDKADDNWTVELSVWTTGAGALESTLSGLTNGTRYDVQVRAVNAIDNGAWSTTVSGKAATVPTDPYLGYAVAGNGQIRIVWSSPDSDGGADIASYDLRYIRSDEDDSDDANWTLKEDFSRTASAYRIRGLTNAVAYHMQVRAVNAAGPGAWSERVTRTPVGPPGTPSIDTVTPGDGSLVITWSPPASDEGRAISSYNLRYVRNDLVGSNFLYVWTEETGIWTSGDLVYTLSGLDNGVRYRLGLQAVNEKGTSGWSDWNNPRTGTAGSTPAAPGAPTIDRATSDGAKAHIRWSPPTSDGGADITGYDLRRIRSDAADKVDGSWTVNSGVWTSGALEYTVEGLTDGVEYDFQLRADNSAGAGSWSATVNNMDPSIPGAPVIGSFWEETPRQLRVFWDAPADDGGALVTHYDLRHIRSDAGDKADGNWTQVDDLTGELNHTIVGLMSRVRYDVQVRAANRAGDGPWSATMTASPKAERPNPPGNISVTPGDGTLTVKWSAAPDKPGVTVAGYKVGYIRSDDPGYNNINNWTTSDLIPSETLEYAITGLQNSVKYTIDAYSISSVGRTSRPPATLPLDSPGRAPAALGSLKRISTHESSIFFSWIGPADNGGHTVTSYDIHYHPTSDPTNVVKRSEPARDIVLGPSTGNNTWVGNLTPHVEYKIQVRARNRIGPGPWSSLTLIPRREPVELTIDSVTEGDGTLTVAWTDGGDDEITGYEVRYTHFRFVFSVAPDSDDWEYRRNITGTSPLEYTIDRLVNGRWYQVQVRGRNRYGELSSDFSNWSGSVSGTPKTVPGAPAVSSVTSGDDMLAVAWAAPASNGGRDITSYDLRYIRSDAPDKADDDNWTVKDRVWSSGALQYDLSGLTNGVAYDVQVRAVNAVDEGPWSPVRTGTAQTVPGMPFIDAATPGDRALSLAWTAPARNGGFDITSYDLRHIRSDAPDKADDNWTVNSSVWTSGDLRHTRSGLTNGVDYDVQVRAVTVVGAGPWSGTLSGTPRTTPGAPTIDAVTPGDQALTMAWAAPDDTGGSTITSYDLRYILSDAPDKADDKWTEQDSIWTAGPLRYTLGSLTSGVGYDMQVRAVNVAGDGRWSGAISGILLTIPAAPTIDTVTHGDEKLTIDWSAPSNTGGDTVTSYDVHYIRSDAPNKADTNWSLQEGIWSSGPRSYDLAGLTNGVRYDVRLRAVTSVGPGPWSAPASATPQTAPDAPTINQVTPGDGALAVSWSSPSDTGGSAITSYDLRYIRSDAPNKADVYWTEEYAIWTAGVLRYTLDLLTNGVEYDVQVRAVNAAGDGLWSATISGVPRTIPAAPTIDAVTPHDETLTIAWSPPADDGGSAITSYDVRYIRSDAPDKAHDNWTVKDSVWTSGALQYDLSGLTNGVEYDVQVRAVNAAGDGPWSTISTDTPLAAPGAPTIARITPGERALSITWTAPASDGGFAITSYDLRYIRSDSPDKADDANWREAIGIWIPGDLLEYRLNEVTGFHNLENSVKYDVQVRAVSRQPQDVPVAGPWSASRTGTPGSVRPPPPSSGGGSSGGGGGGRSRATPTPTPTPSPTPTATPTPTPIPTPTGPQYSGVIAAEPSVTATVVPEGTTLGLNGGGDEPGGVYVNFPPTAVALPVPVSVSVSNEAPDDVEAPSGTTLLSLTIDINPETPLTLGTPLTIEINPTPEQLAAAGGDLNHLAVGVVTPNGVVVLPAQVLHGRLVVTIDHLSTFVLLAVTNPGPMLTHPPPGDASSMGPLLQWTQPPGTTWFQVQVIPFNEDGPGINLVIGDGALVQAAQYQVMAPNFGSADPNYVLLPDMTYLWRVRTSTALTNPTEADWSAWAASSFKTPPASSSTITRVAPPLYGVVRTLTPTLTWANSDPAVFYYEVQLSKDFEFGPNAFRYSEYVHGGASTPANSYVVPAAFPLEAGAFYYWRVRPRIQGDGDPLPWSSTYVFEAPG